VKSYLINKLRILAKCYFSLPVNFGKEWLWRNWVEKYLLWRKSSYQVSTVFGMRINITFPDQIQSYLYFFGIWEPEISSYILSKLKLGDIFVDVGSNIGYYSLLASSRVGQDGQVFAIEASPSIFSELQKNITLNGITNVSTFNVAVTDDPKKVEIFKGKETNIGMSTILSEEASRRGAFREAVVSGQPLPKIIDESKLSRAKFIKIDVEGAEWLVIKGMRDIVKNLGHDTEILIEINSQSVNELGGTVNELFDMFLSAGFKIFEIKNSYNVISYIQKNSPKLKEYDGKDFIQKDFVLKKPLEQNLLVKD